MNPLPSEDVLASIMLLLPSPESFSLLLRKCSKDRLVASRLLAHLCDTGLAAHASFGNLAIFSMIDTTVDAPKPQKILDTLHCKDPCSYNSLIIGYVNSGELKLALNVYQSLRDGPVYLNEFAFVALIKACAKLKDAERGHLLHIQISQRGLLESNIIVGTVLVDMYAKCGMLSKAHEVFDKLPHRDVVAWTALISGYAQLNQAKEALRIFELMQHQDVIPNAATFVCILKSCADAGDENKGSEVHVEISRRGLFETNQLIGNALVDMYSKCGSLVKAREVFDKLPNRDIVAWTALMSGYAQCGHGQDALNCFDQMQVLGISPDAATLVCILKACATIGSVEKGAWAHSELARKGTLENNAVAGAALVDMYAKCGELVTAQEVFDRLVIRNIDSWNALITGYAQRNCGIQVLKCLEQMLCHGVCPDTITIACCLKACGNIGSINAGKKLLVDIEKGSLKSNQVVHNTLLDVYSKCGMRTNAEEIFEKLEVHDVISWNILMTCYNRLRKFIDVLQAFDTMIREGVMPNAVTFVCVLSACCHARLLERGKRHFEEMNVKYGIVRTLDHHTCMIHLLAHAGELFEAEGMMKRMSSPPDIVLLLAILSACEKWGNIELGRHIFDQAVQLDPSETAAYTCMQNIYAGAGMHSEAKEIKMMLKRRRNCVKTK